MKSTLAVSSRGVITLPAKLRELLGIRANDHVIAEATANGILLRPAVTLPIEVYSAARVEEFDAAEAKLAEAMKRKTGTSGRVKTTSATAANAKTGAKANAVKPKRTPSRNARNTRTRERPSA